MTEQDAQIKAQMLSAELYSTASNITPGEHGSYNEITRNAFIRFAYEIDMAAAKFRMGLHK